MLLTDTIRQIASLDTFQDLVGGIDTYTEAPLGFSRAARLPVSAALHQSLERPILLVTDRTDRAFSLADELALWAPQSTRLIVPEPNALFYEDTPWGLTARRDRLAALTRLALRQLPGHKPAQPEDPPFLIAPARALMTRTIPRRDFLKATHILKTGMEKRPDDLARAWFAMGYEPVNTVISPGQFARRGGILDIWPPAAELPVRLDFFGDEIDTLRTFEPTTQRTAAGISERTQRIAITPAREFIDPNQDLADSGIDDFDPANYPSEFDIPRLHPTTASLIDYLPD